MVLRTRLQQAQEEAWRQREESRQRAEVIARASRLAEQAEACALTARGAAPTQAGDRLCNLLEDLRRVLAGEDPVHRGGPPRPFGMSAA